MFFGKKKWDPQGKHCYVTGGSTGLGLALSILLATKGAHVTIVARTENKLQAALKEIEAARQYPEQQFRYHSFALDTADASAQAIQAECDANGGRAPDAFFLCAGSARPSFFIEETEATMLNGMESAYWIQAWSALAATKKLVQQKQKGNIVFVGSVVSFMSFIGYSSYSPGKHALKGLAETLRSELLLYGIDVHIFFPPTMKTPGYEIEMQTKPAVQKKIEETDDGITPEQGAAAIIKGVEKGQHQIAADLITNLFRSSSRGSAPMNHLFLDQIYDVITWIATPVWRRGVDKSILAHRREHEEYLTKQGFFSKST
ncbi:oxidoreductase [Sistotremastrum niveocremeum HHB9708]|uniref:3-dehydrosphinganine reductase n=1 Tax=Sistotremastrum niveocremeum HHB9708 TaxID=1314777 RepID=A0A164YMK5_9AGAM|nr:oxidoreductase [Sistotremastrum niveocremeum HHB9708]